MSTFLFLFAKFLSMPSWASGESGFTEKSCPKKDLKQNALPKTWKSQEEPTNILQTSGEDFLQRLLINPFQSVGNSDVHGFPSTHRNKGMLLSRSIFFMLSRKGVHYLACFFSRHIFASSFYVCLFPKNPGKNGDMTWTCLNESPEKFTKFEPQKIKSEGLEEMMFFFQMAGWCSGS